MRVLFLTLYPDNAPSSRFRIYQYRPYLEKQNIHCSIEPVLPRKLFLTLYNRTDIFRRLIFHNLELLSRLKSILTSNRFNLVVVQKGLTSINLRGLEQLLSISNNKIIFDFDDAVFGLTQFLPSCFRFLQDARQVERLIGISNLVIAGNKYLADFATQFNHSVCVLPTPIDTDMYRPNLSKNDNRKVTIGWSGSMGTNFYANYLIPILNKLTESFSFKFKIISNNLEGFHLGKLDKKIEFEFSTWQHQTEVTDLQSIDIGTMPLNNDTWSKGKCGLKALQFMALSIPVICSPVGVNTEIIKSGINGFLASSEEEWIDKLTLLIKDASLRKILGKAGRETVEEKYSLKVNAPKLKQILEKGMS